MTFQQETYMNVALCCKVVEFVWLNLVQNGDLHLKKVKKAAILLSCRLQVSGKINFSYQVVYVSDIAIVREERKLDLGIHGLLENVLDTSLQ